MYFQSTLWNLSDNNIGYEEIKKIADILKGNNLSQVIKGYNTTLQQLDLNYNSIREKGAKELAEALKCATDEHKIFLKGLYLEFNWIGDEGARDFAASLKVSGLSDTLQQLNLASNRIRDNGATYLAQALETNTSLIELNLGNNLIGNNGAIRIAEALKTNKTLRQLVLKKIK